ncbi:ATP-binding cassette domain-containing protein [Anaerolentibacter hominis]|uniref:ATP-binding cassette domain-containing protein n=1 Tax=Anaerolentibacter hominis TaxID=3079009 RepID=UPI0031B85DA6
MLQVEHLFYEVIEEGRKRTIVNDVSFQVQDGEMLVVTGPNGGGKTTIGRLLIGIEKASSGRIHMDGADLTDLDIEDRAKAGIGFAFQQPPRFKGMTVERLLALAAGRELPEEECCHLLSGVGLCAREYLKREVDATLSGGEMKRIEIATVLAKPHKICIFDEPEAGIDLWSFSMLIKQFEQIHREKQESLILISHQERIIRMADRIMVVQDGRIRELGTQQEIAPVLFGAEGEYQEEFACMSGNGGFI